MTAATSDIPATPPPTYRCQLFFLAVSRSGGRSASRWIDLPFAPYPGLVLVQIRPDRGEGLTVEAVTWRHESRTFLVRLEGWHDPDYPLAKMKEEFGPDWEWGGRS